MGSYFMPTTLPPDAAISDILATLAKPEHYVRGILENLYECKRQHGNATVRLGTTGQGIVPHYRIDYSQDIGIRRLESAIFGAFDGRSHKPIVWLREAGELDGTPLRQEHWSARFMIIEEVANLLGQIRRSKKGGR
jgi:hypothetical protein